MLSDDGGYEILNLNSTLMLFLHFSLNTSTNAEFFHSCSLLSPSKLVIPEPIPTATIVLSLTLSLLV